MSSAILELPHDILEACAALRASKPMRTQESVNDDRLARLCQVVKKRRDRHVTERKASGIEDVWMACEEAYLGIDDANRHEFNKARWCKPVSMNGPVQKEHRPGKTGRRSTVYVRMTARYVDAGAAKLAEILLPPDDKSFSFEPTPVPDLIAAQDDESQVTDPVTGLPLERDPKPTELAQPTTPAVAPHAPPVGAGAPSAPAVVDVTTAPGVPLKKKDLVEEALARAQARAKKAETKIYDWLVECRHRGESRKVIFDAAKLGVGVMKGPFPSVRRSRAVSRTEQGYALTMLEEVVPTTKHISAWDFYPDPDCGENIHDGSAVFERDRISHHQLEALKRSPGFLASQIDKVLAQGPNKHDVTDDPRQRDTLSDERFEIWYGTLYFSREDLLFINDLRPDLDDHKRQALRDELPTEMDEISVCVAIVNDEIIRAVRNHLESGEFGYHCMPWQRRDGSWAGVGIPEQGAGPQRIVNAATRAMLDNAGVAAGGQIVMARGSIDPADGVDEITPNKLWYLSGEATIDDVEKAFHIFTFPNLQDSLMNIVNFGQRLMEESTNIPLITQGQSGDTTPDTLGATEMQNNNANQLLRSIGYAYDDYMTEPMILQYYEWLLLDPAVPEDCKGDFKINARGSATLVERSIANQYLASLATVVSNPIYGNDPKKWMDEMHKANKIDPRKIKFSEADQKKIDETPPPAAPAVEAAKIRAEVDQLKIQAQTQQQQLELQTREAIAARDTDRDKAYVEAETERTQVERELRIQELQLKLQLAQIEYANKREMTLEQVKADLAKETMRLTTQKELATADREAAPVATPAVEPPGRAEDGKAFQQ